MLSVQCEPLSTGYTDPQIRKASFRKVLPLDQCGRAAKFERGAADEAFQRKGIVEGCREASIELIADLPDPDPSRCRWQRPNAFLFVDDCSHEAPTKTVSEVYPKSYLDKKSFFFKGLK